VATLLHDQGVPALTEAFKAYGMDLLTPETFLDTDARREFHDSFGFKVGAGTAFARALEGHGKENTLSNRKTSVSLGYDLTKGLGVDAALVICNLLKATRKTGSLEGVYFYLFGPHAIPGEDSFTYWPGHLYVGLRRHPLARRSDAPVREGGDGFEVIRPPGVRRLQLRDAEAGGDR
jgi:hypothetical protein